MKSLEKKSLRFGDKDWKPEWEYIRSSPFSLIVGIVICVGIALLIPKGYPFLFFSSKPDKKTVQSRT